MERTVTYIPAITLVFLALSPLAMNTTFCWLVSAFPFSKKKTLSTP